MTVTWVDWGARQPGPPYTGTSPNLALLRDELLKRFGGTYLGGYGVRPVRGGKRWSAHAAGSAIDWRNDDDAARAAALAWMLDEWDALGVQQIHDYANCSIWRAHRYPAQPVEAWWRPQQANAATGMGQPWAKWLHVETDEGNWGNTKPIVQRLQPTASPAVLFDPAEGLWGLYPLDKAKPTLRRLDGPRTQPVHDATRYLQGVLRRKAAQPITVDGDFGPSTDTAVRNVQRFFGLQVDGVVGPKTWAVIDLLAAK